MRAIAAFMTITRVLKCVPRNAVACGNWPCVLIPVLVARATVTANVTMVAARKENARLQIVCLPD